MSNTAHCVKRFGKLAAADAASDVVLRSIPEGEIVRVEISRPSRRSLQHHKLFFSLLSVVADHMDWTTEQALCWAKIAVGHTDVVYDRDGVVTYVPKSISFARMTQDEFNSFFDAAMKAILDRLLPPGTSEGDLVQEVHERAGMRRAAA